MEELGVSYGGGLGRLCIVNEISSKSAKSLLTTHNIIHDRWDSRRVDEQRVREYAQAARREHTVSETLDKVTEEFGSSISRSTLYNYL